MKIRIDIDITPQELRDFFGLPDVQPIQNEFLEKVQENMRAGVDGFDPLTLLKPLIPNNPQMIEAMQQAFWSGFTPKKDAPEKE